LSDVTSKAAAVEGALTDRPLPRLLQQLYRKQLTGHFVVTDQTRDESLVYLRSGWPVHVCRPVDTDRLDNLLVEYGLLPAEVVAQASTQVGQNQRLGDVLERMGAIDRQKLAQVLKTQVVRKLIRLFFVAEGSYAVYVQGHGYGEGEEFALMRVDPRTVILPGIRAAYDLPRVTRELSRLAGQRFRLANLSPAFVTALGISGDDVTVEALRAGWMTLDDLDSVTSRTFEVRSVALALYYTGSLEREPLGPAPSDSFAPELLSSSPPPPPLAASAADTERAPASRLETASVAAPARTGNGAAGAPAAAPATPSQPAPPVILAPAPPTGSSPAVCAPAATAPAAARLSGTRPVVTAMPPAVAAGRPAGVAAAKTAAAAAPEAIRASILDMAAKLDKSTHFEILGVSGNATSDEVSVAFVRAARQFHPDRLAGTGLTDLQPQAERILARINEAVMVLQNPGRRAEYVASLSAAAPPSTQNVPTVLEAENLFLKGEVFLKKGDHAKAIEAFTAAGKGNPEEPQYRAYLAWARFEDPRARKEAMVRETLKVLEGVLKERPKFVRGHYWLGLLWKFLNEIPKAEQAFREAVQIDAAFIEAGRELRLIEMRKNKAQAKPKEPEPPRGLMGKLWKR
jgi:DnaJ-domain-containing protein 1